VALLAAAHAALTGVSCEVLKTCPLKAT